MMRFTPTLGAECARLKKRVHLVCLFGFLALLATPWIRPVSAAGDEPRISYSEMRTSGRPGNFYKLGFNANDRVCQSALQLLNQPIAMKPNLRAGYDYAKIDTAFFLGTHANVTWEPRWLITEQSRNGRAGALDVTTADIFNTGQVLHLHRFEGSVRSHLLHSIYAVPAERLHEHLADSETRVEGLRTITVRFSELREYQLDFFPTFAREALGTGEYPWAGVFADVVDVGGKRYVIATSAVEKYRRNSVYLLEFFSHKDRRLVCGYRSEYVFVSE